MSDNILSVCGMSEELDEEQFLGKAAESEKEYDWLEAADFYGKALIQVHEADCSKLGQIQKRMGYAFYHAATQADDVDEFIRRMRLSAESYEKAVEMLAQIAPARALYCKGMARYSDSWYAEDASHKKRSLDDCRRLLKEALDGFAVTGDALGYGEAFHHLAFCLWDRISFAESLRESKEIVDEVTRYGQTAITTLSKVGSADELAWAYAMTSNFLIMNLDYFEERRAEFLSSISEYLRKPESFGNELKTCTFSFSLIGHCV